MAGRLEDRIFFSCQISEQDAKKLLRIGLKLENAVIKEAYLGRWPALTLAGTEAPYGLYITVDFESYGTATATYTKMEDIEGLLKQFEVQRTEWLKGRKVTAYMVGMHLAGLSARRQE